ncbi:sugar transferase [Exiguobacterium sp. s160]|uniref:sugar transferase n=1 Tax=Exiguobacterium sp. s160 TaxID=2751265 RepID=UPI001BE9405A|nr:sugar transferase [Exiguobacterium sp. s160]
MSIVRTDNEFNNFYEEYAVSTQNIYEKGNNYNVYEQVFFRAFDILFAILAFIVSVPIMLVTILLIRLESPGSAFYVQKRVGLNGNYFNMYKFRSMHINAEIDGPQWAKKDDNRVTKVGKIIRKMRIDELPQLLNVLVGDMSLIGPRPERPNFTAEFNNDIPDFVLRLSVKPGLTGWAQVNGGYEITPHDKLLLDLYYVKHKSLKLDILIIIKTIKVIFTGEGAR